jgi:glycosyltransferase involved in cell wall biosynthesis
VGDGALRQEAQEYAQRLGIADRVLFTGLSGSVGYWLTRMDTLMLLSRFEGMPNVLIEAQLAGKPVVTTPAGGAPETVLNGRTGWVLSSAETIDIEEAAAHLFDMSILSAARRNAMSESARAWAEQAFSVESMLERTVRVFMAPYPMPMLPEVKTVS